MSTKQEENVQDAKASPTAETAARQPGKKKLFPRMKPDLPQDRSLPKPSRLSTTSISSPLPNDPLWLQSFINESERGLTSGKSKVFNADASGYVALVEQEYNVISGCDNFINRTVPRSAFAYYHHILWWYRVATIAQKHGEASHAQNRLIHFINGYDIVIGAGIATYLMGMGDYTDGTGVKHYLKAREPNQDGHFGQIDEQTYRDYETLIAPAVSMGRVLTDCRVTINRANVEFLMPRGVLPAPSPAPQVPLAAPVRRRRQRQPDIMPLVPCDKDIREGTREGLEDEGDEQEEAATTNLLGWRVPVPMNKNQAAELLSIIKNPLDVEYVNNTYRVHREVFEYVNRRLRESSTRYKIMKLPKSWKPTAQIFSRNR